MLPYIFVCQKLLINTQLQLGVRDATMPFNRFSGFTVESVSMGHDTSERGESDYFELPSLEPRNPTYRWE
jgi:hypothetical protein